MAESALVRAVVALGSNTGDRVSNLRRAAAAVSQGGWLHAMRFSSVYDSPPERPGDGGAFANAVLSGDTALSPRSLLQALLEVEATLGRERVVGVHGGPRSIDLDLVLHGGHVIDEPGLRVPHPRFASRAFVLVPLAEIEPSLVNPRDGRSIHSLLAALPTEPLLRLGPLWK